MTGFLIMVRGCNFRKESTIAVFRILVSFSTLAFACESRSMDSLERLSREHQQMLENRPQAQCREKCESPHNQNCRNKKNTEERAGHRESAQGSRSGFLCSKIPGNREDGDHDKKPAHQHCKGSAGVVPGRIRIEAAKGRAVVADRRGVRVQNLRE